MLGKRVADNVLGNISHFICRLQKKKKKQDNNTESYIVCTLSKYQFKYELTAFKIGNEKHVRGDF